MKQEAVRTSIGDHLAENRSGIMHDVTPPPVVAECDLQADRFAYSCAPPISESVDGDQSLQNQMQVNVAGVSVLRPRHRRSLKNLRSTGWLISIMLHVVIFLCLMLVLVPADFGGMSTLSFLVTTDQSEPQEQLTVFEVGVSEEQQPLEESPPTLPTPLTGLRSPDGVNANTSGSSPSGGPRGSFFGIEARGHEFVYVLDMSTSMEGQRSDRARAELMRSVEQLSPNQKFFVMLFCGKTRQMFDRSDYLPQSVDATPENKERLANWLRSMSLGPGTDPREALEVAMRMNPAAIFILSDGEFNGHENQKREKLLGGNSDVFSIVAAATAKPPIHSIAFEDNKSQENMRRLAEMTTGQYRFVGQSDGTNPEDSIKYVRTAVMQGDLATTELFIREAVANLAQVGGEDTTQYKVELARILFELAENGLKQGEFAGARRVLVDYAYVFPQDEMMEKLQGTLVGNLLDRLKSNPDGAGAVPLLLTEFVKKSPKSPAAKRVHDSLGQTHLDEARQLYSKGDYLASIRNLEKVIATFPESEATPECRVERDRISGELLDEAKQLREQQGNAESATHLRRLASKCGGTQFHKEVIQALEMQAKEMLVEVRDASYSRDWTTRGTIQQELAAGFGDDPVLTRVRQELAAHERTAQETLRRAIRMDKTSQRTAAIGLYRTLINDFSGTSAAQLAAERMRVLGQR